MKLKPSLAVLAVALAALAQPALEGFQFTQNEKGEVTHYNGILLPPIPTVEEARAQAQKEIAAAQKAREAQQAEPATRHSLPATPPQEVFFTGKPYLEETGQYLFLFRHYDPELARWTTADPSGFPDGTNNVAYMPVPTMEFDWQGLFTLSTTTPSPATSYDPSGRYFAEAFNISHVSAGSGMANQLASLLGQHYPTYSTTVSPAGYNGTANVQKYGARNTDRNGISRGALDFQVVFSGGGSDFTWLQIVRSRTSSSTNWTHWWIDTTGFGAPSYDISNDPVIYDLPTLGAWTYDGVVSGASKEFYTFAATCNGNHLVIHDGFYWGGVIKE